MATAAAVGERARAALAEERESLAAAHRRRMGELDGIRRLLETRAGDVEAAHRSLEGERARWPAP